MNVYLKGNYYNLYADMLEQTHLLIGGRTGAGKSTIINALLTTVLIKNFPTEKQFILLDAKGTELADYEKVPHTIYYGCTPTEMQRGLDIAFGICQKRFRENRRKHRKIYEGSDVYVVVDELASLVLKNKPAQDTLKRIMELGRACKVHCICGTQNFLSACIPTQIKVNFTSIVGLQTRNASDSRVLIGERGCEQLKPLNYEGGTGECIYQTPHGNIKTLFPVIYQDEIMGNVLNWTQNMGLKGLLRGLF